MSATMKACALFILCQPAIAGAVSAESAAKAWLRSHQLPSGGELGELANANPQAFAIVSALLNKRHKNTLPESERGPNVFLKMMGPRHLSAAVQESRVTLPYNVPEAGAAESTMAMQDPKSYDPSRAEDKDASMVDGLLGAVANLAGGGKAGKIALLRKHYQQKDEQTQQVADAVFNNPFGNAAPKKPVTTGPLMSEEEKEQRTAAGLPLTDTPMASHALLAEHAAPSLYVVAAATVEPDMARVEAPKPKNALAAWLR